MAEFNDDAFTVGPQSGPVARALTENQVEHTVPRGWAPVLRPGRERTPHEARPHSSASRAKRQPSFTESFRDGSSPDVARTRPIGLNPRFLHHRLCASNVESDGLIRPDGSASRAGRPSQNLYVLLRFRQRAG